MVGELPLGKPRFGIGILGDPPGGVIAVEPRQLEGISGIIDRRADERLHALSHKTGIRSIDEHDWARRIGTRQNPIDLAAIEGNHGVKLTSRR